MARLKVLFVASECVPFAKTGGLGDVVGALPIALAARGHDVRVVLPRYRVTVRHPAERHASPLGVPIGRGEAWCAVWESRIGPRGSVRVYLLEHGELYDREGIYGDAHGEFGDNLARFVLVSRGALQLCKSLGFHPDVVHVHDWQTSLVPVYLNTLERGGPLGRAATVLSIHNMGYQGWFEASDYFVTQLPWALMQPQGLETYGRLHLLKGGIYHATAVSTVSPRYAWEITTPEGGEGLDGALRDRGDRVVGILNGIDDEVWNPRTDPYIAARYSAEDLSGKAACKAALQREFGLPERPDVPLIGLITRFAEQKGVDIFAGAVEMLRHGDVQFVVLGSGEPWAEHHFSRLSHGTGNVRAYIGMNEGLAHRIEAGVDLFAMPSRYEPCGLNQLYSQRYGTLPVVRAVGGLDDTVENFATGFKFDDLRPEALAQALLVACSIYRNSPTQFRAMQKRAMEKPVGWSHAAPQYEALYRLAIRRRNG